jgi:hypothetical protein
MHLNSDLKLVIASTRSPAGGGSHTSNTNLFKNAIASASSPYAAFAIHLQVSVLHLKLCEPAFEPIPRLCAVVFGVTRHDVSTGMKCLRTQV